MKEPKLEDIVIRLERLEKTVLTAKRPQEPRRSDEAFVGPSGGVHLLISQGFFKTKRRLGEVRTSLAKYGYHYGAPQVQTALNRLSTRTGPLAVFKEGGKKIYVRRK